MKPEPVEYPPEPGAEGSSLADPGPETIAPEPEPQQKAKKAAKVKARIERYLYTKPGGEIVTIEHNIDSGTTRVIGAPADPAADTEKSE